MYRHHWLAVGVNSMGWKKNFPKYELGIKADFDYRFTKKNSRVLTPESSVQERALHSDFDLIFINPMYNSI